MADAPRNAGQSITVENVVKGPVTTIDFGAITVTENWGRLFMSQPDRPDRKPLVVLQGAYPALIAAIQHFSTPATPPATVVEALERALREMRSRFGPVPREDTEGWREEHEACEAADTALAALTAWRAGK